VAPAALPVACILLFGGSEDGASNDYLIAVGGISTLPVVKYSAVSAAS
jgi:hypothetical protein